MVIAIYHKFQFPNGSIKSAAPVAVTARSLLFQFPNGSIKRNNFFENRANSACFNSLMVRLKDCANTWIIFIHFCFNSLMVRLKGRTCYCYCQITAVSIP